VAIQSIENAIPAIVSSKYRALAQILHRVDEMAREIAAEARRDCR
jgi:hypothetical protein